MGASVSYIPFPILDKHTEEFELNDGVIRGAVCSMQGWRRGMEDSHCYHFDSARKIGKWLLSSYVFLAIFGVFDGHGGSGVSAFSAKYLPSVILKSKDYQEGNFGK
jgi:protein phosphatase PTC2/3